MSFYEILRSAPYIRLLLPFIIGILSAQLYRFPLQILWSFLAILFASILIINISSVSDRFRLRWLWGFLLTVFIILCGFLAEKSNSTKGTLPKSEVIVAGTILENPKITTSSYQVMVRLDAIKENKQWKSVDKKIICTLQKKKCKQSVVLNQRILLKGYWTEVRNNGNPYEFDYKTYLNRNGIYYRAYIDTLNWSLLGENQNFSITVWALQVRDKILEYYKQLNMSPSAFAVVSALTVGDKSYLDAEIKTAYINSGTMHILAVSGMHVALLFWLLQQITRPLMFWKRGKLLRAIIVLMVIWIYAMITGLTPSVVRASVMFSFWMLGETGNRKVNIYNTLSASALLLLIINPDTIFDIGFQLSYLAVLGIVVFYSDIYHLFYLQNRILKYIWSMVAVSLAAQLFTLPVSLYNFHQFPNYFLLSNIIALPLSTIILYGSILALVLVPFKFLWIPVGWLLKTFVDWMNNGLIWVENLPYSVTTGIWISGLMALCIFIMVSSIRFYIYRKKALYIFLVLICSIICSANIYLKRKSVLQTQDITVYNAPGTLVMQFRYGQENYVVKDSSVYDIERLLKPAKDHLLLKKPKVLFINEQTTLASKQLLIYKGFIYFQNKKMFIWRKNPDFYKLPVRVDVLIIDKLSKKDLHCLDEYFEPREIIVSNKVFRSIANEIKEHYDGQNIRCTILNTDGAWFLSNMKKIDK